MTWYAALAIALGAWFALSVVMVAAICVVRAAVRRCGR